MKFCTKCGAELLDEAVICTKCGCMVEGMGAPGAKSKKQTGNGVLDATCKQPSAVLSVFNFLFSLFATIALFWILIAVADISWYGSGSYYSGYGVTGYVRFYSDYIILAGVGALFSFGAALVSFILTLVEKHRGERLFSAISRLVAGILLLIATCCFLA